MPNWNDVLTQITNVTGQHMALSRAAPDLVRREYLGKLHEMTGRHVIAYYSGFLSKPRLELSDINDEDKNGFMMAVHNLADRKRTGLDLILHTPGGSLSATQSIVNYLRKMFGDNIRAIIPQIAMSAGTILACSCKSIVMAKHSNLGPIDPQLGGLPAYGVIEEFQRAYKEIKADPKKALVWSPILSKYTPSYLTRCENAIKSSQEYVEHELSCVMFAKNGKATKAGKKKAKAVVRALSNYKAGHDNHLHQEDCQNMGLIVEPLEKDPKLQDLVLTVHHCYMHALMNTPSFKIIENQLGVAFIKQQQVMALRQA